MKKLRMGVIGCGMAWNRLHLPAVLELHDKYIITAMSDTSNDILIRSADRIGLAHENLYTDYKRMLERTDLDVINIAVPIHLNYSISRDVAKAGFDFICEKPLASSMDEALEFLKLEDMYNVKILIAENFRYNEEVNIIKDLVHNEKVGKIVHFVKNHVTNFPEKMKENTFEAKEWRQHPRFKGGIFLDSAVHEMAVIRYIFGGISKVSAFGEDTNDDYTPYSAIHAALKFHSGVLGSYTYWAEGNEPQRPLIGFRIFGTEGSIYLEDKFCGCVNIFYNDGGHEIIPFTPERGYYNEFLDFYNALVSENKVDSAPIVEFGDMKMVMDILDAVKTESVIDVTEGTRFCMQLREEIDVK